MNPLASLTNRNILLGITGGIAAYKSAELVRRLQDAGAEVRVVMTAAAQEFITPLTLQALSGNPVHTDLLDSAAEAAMGHIELARWADLIIIAPASADIIARMTQGEANDLLTAVCLASRCPLVIAPAMNQAMWRHAATQRNIRELQTRGVIQLGPDIGSQACGDVGFGRMSAPDELTVAIAGLFQTGSLTGKCVVITAGPTREAIDPVRYISNYSSGKMGYALARAAVDAGARVQLISGPTAISPPEHVELIRVLSADQMYQASMQTLPSCDIFIAAAAVADYRPVSVATRKIKKTSGDTVTLEMIKTPDIVSAVAAAANKPFVVGFAAETDNIINHARSKLKSKQLDLVIANDVSDSSIGFGSDHNAVTLIGHNSQHVLAKASKQQLARDIIHHIASMIDKAEKEAVTEKQSKS